MAFFVEVLVESSNALSERDFDAGLVAEIEPSGVSHGQSLEFAEVQKAA